MLFFQEQIQDPEKACIARSYGLVRYQIHSEIMMAFGDSGSERNRFVISRQTGTKAMRSGAHEKATLPGRGLQAGEGRQRSCFQPDREGGRRGMTWGQALAGVASVSMGSSWTARPGCDLRLAAHFDLALSLLRPNPGQVWDAFARFAIFLIAAKPVKPCDAGVFRACSRKAQNASQARAGLACVFLPANRLRGGSYLVKMSLPCRVACRR